MGSGINNRINEFFATLKMLKKEETRDLKNVKIRSQKFNKLKNRICPYGVLNIRLLYNSTVIMPIRKVWNL